MIEKDKNEWIKNVIKMIEIIWNRSSLNSMKIIKKM